ncbi:ABC transporter-associated protein EcsC [Marivirga lumbricoides]|uniref:ABC transporter-associated protein EcsC n=1 Tax=Marivirga lumbricoides TaxID=1046115 RepID=A0ABQ1LUP0_9BACT|nr:ABC transporter-associated protein EcsC [Marivirga lumbricoides]
MKIDENAAYFLNTYHEYWVWRMKMSKRPTLLNKMAKGVQHKINGIIPEKVHIVITKAVKEIIRGVLFGAEYTTFQRIQLGTLEEVEQLARKKISIYASSSAAEGAITGFGGFFSSLADFPLWLSLKMKMLFEIANAYGIDVKDYKERLFILHIFQLTFSSQKHRKAIFQIMSDWEQQKELLPNDIHEFDWRTFQLEYRDYIDLAKLIQLIPGIGAISGAYVNHTYTKKLGKNAMNAYRMRIAAYHS